MLTLLVACALATSSGPPAEGEVWSCEKAVVGGINAWGNMDEGKFLAPFSGSATSATFSPNEPGDKAGNAKFSPILLELRDGQEVEVSLSVTNMTCSFSAINMTDNAQKSLHKGVRDPWTPPADSLKFKFTFKGHKYAKSAGISFTCKPTQSAHYYSCGVYVAYAFKRGPRVAKETDLKLEAVDCHTWTQDDYSGGKPHSYFPMPPRSAGATWTSSPGTART